MKKIVVFDPPVTCQTCDGFGVELTDNIRKLYDQAFVRHQLKFVKEGGQPPKLDVLLKEFCKGRKVCSACGGSGVIETGRREISLDDLGKESGKMSTTVQKRCKLCRGFGFSGTADDYNRFDYELSEATDKYINTLNRKVLWLFWLMVYNRAVRKPCFHCNGNGYVVCAAR